METERKIVKCKGCGADIFFQDGTPWFAKRVPILVMVDDALVGKAEMKTTGYVSHFINCPKANHFSGSKG